MPDFFTFFCFLLTIFLFTIAPKYSVQVLPNDLKLRKAVMCLTEDIHVRKAPLRCDSAVDHKVSVHDQQYTFNKVSLNRSTHKTSLCID